MEEDVRRIGIRCCSPTLSDTLTSDSEPRSGPPRPRRGSRLLVAFTPAVWPRFARPIACRPADALDAVRAPGACATAATWKGAARTPIPTPDRPAR